MAHQVQFVRTNGHKPWAREQHINRNRLQPKAKGSLGNSESGTRHEINLGMAMCAHLPQDSGLSTSCPDVLLQFRQNKAYSYLVHYTTDVKRQELKLSYVHDWVNGLLRRCLVTRTRAAQTPRVRVRRATEWNGIEQKAPDFYLP